MYLGDENLRLKKGQGMVLKAKPGAAENGTPTDAVRLLKLDLRTMTVGIQGTSSLIVHRRSPKIIEKIIRKQAGEAMLPNYPKDPEENFRESCYLMPGSSWDSKKPRFGFPAVGFKIAMVEAANDMDLKMTETRRAFHVLEDDGGLVELAFAELRHRADGAPNSGAGSGLDIRHRGEFVGWSVKLRIRYNASVITAEQVVNLLNVAGFGVGVGEWRIKGKKSTGTHGGWEVIVG